MPNDKDSSLHMPSLTPSAFEMHVLAYAVAVGLGYGGFSFSIPLVTGLFFYGTFLEVAQYFIPTRAFNPFDALANVVGLFIGTFIYFFTSKRLSATDSL